jgi:ferrochelatase
MIAEKLGLIEEEYVVTFQSRFGKQVWLQPYTDEILEKLAGEGVDSVDIFCPGFLCDCLETLEEINMQSRENYLSSGGKSFNYISALNDYEKNIESMEEIILGEILNWDNNILNSKDNVEITKKAFDEQTYNKNI